FCLIHEFRRDRIANLCFLCVQGLCQVGLNHDHLDGVSGDGILRARERCAGDEGGCGGQQKSNSQASHGKASLILRNCLMDAFAIRGHGTPTGYWTAEPAGNSPTAMSNSVWLGIWTFFLSPMK